MTKEKKNMKPYHRKAAATTPPMNENNTMSQKKKEKVKWETADSQKKNRNENRKIANLNT